MIEKLAKGVKEKMKLEAAAIEPGVPCRIVGDPTIYRRSPESSFRPGHRRYRVIAFYIFVWPARISSLKLGRVTASAACSFA